MSLICFLLNHTRAESLRNTLQGLNKNCSTLPFVEVNFMIGTHDRVVNFDSPYLSEVNTYNGVTVNRLEGLGHECIAENSTMVSNMILATEK